MNNIALLDCTLREAPLDGLKWGEMSLHKTIHDMGESQIEYIECGFLKDGLHEEGSAYFSSASQIRDVIGEKHLGTQYVALVDYGRYDLEQLENYDGTSVDLIRVCFKKEEVNKVISYAKDIMKKGYKVSIQHVNTIAYSQEEIIQFVQEVNQLHPYAYALVDTFGSMYEDDLLSLCELVDKYLDCDIKLGFHAHNNLMLANANVFSFIEKMKKKRNLIVDASLFGCGRGAGNANTELIARYLNQKHGKQYDVDMLLDLIDTVVNAAKKKVSWGYSIPYFIAGMNDMHSFNVKYLTQQHNIRSKDLRAIVEQLDEKQKKKYDYNYLEQLYLDYFNVKINDSVILQKLTRLIGSQPVILLAPGKSVMQERKKIIEFIEKNSAFVIGVNNVIPSYQLDAVFYSGVRRYELLPYIDRKQLGTPLIIKSSNIKERLVEEEIVVDYGSLLKQGWSYMDSSIILLLRLLARLKIEKITIAGLDGYKRRGEAFYEQELETALSERERKQATEENLEMLVDFHNEHPEIEVVFLTESDYKEAFCRGE